ncbi:MAG TPA: DUF3575 domain-containing protein [Chitinophagaceae bacterium]|nr:DUF3575 domain-containing protein [Chitinophagaceae bacterium]
MKKVLLAASLLVAATALKAQDNGVQNAVKLNPLSLAFATGNVAYERAISANSSIQLGIFYTGVGISDLKYSGLGITPEYRIYFAGNRTALNGVYVGPFVRYQNFTVKFKNTDPEVKASYSSFGGGALIGWEKTWESGFVLDLFAGPSYNKGKLTDKSDPNAEFDLIGSIDGFGIRTGITLGFAF